jgi:hypothetical protein
MSRQYNSNNSLSNKNVIKDNDFNSNKPKNETVKVFIRLRPLLQHEDVEFWKIDEHTNNIYTVK